MCSLLHSKKVYQNEKSTLRNYFKFSHTEVKNTINNGVRFEILEYDSETVLFYEQIVYFNIKTYFPVE